MPATRHAYDEIVVVRVDGAGNVSLEPRWPSGLPPFPGSARYAPAERIVSPPGGNPRAALVPVS
jgi:hypothetical protein